MTAKQKKGVWFLVIGFIFPATAIDFLTYQIVESGSSLGIIIFVVFRVIKLFLVVQGLILIFSDRQKKDPGASPETNQNKPTNKKALGKGEITASIILILLIIIFSFTAGRSNAAGRFNDWNFAFLPYALLFFPLSIISLVLAGNFLLRKKIHILSILLLIFGFYAFPLFSLRIVGKYISPLYYQQTSIEHAIEEQKEEEEYEASADRAYELIEEYFKVPRKVLHVYEGHGESNPAMFLFLEQGVVVTPQMYEITKVPEFIPWAKTNLIGKYVTVEIPEWAKSRRLFYTCDTGGLSTVIDWRRKYNLPEDNNSFCSPIEAEIFFNGKPLDESFDIYPYN